MSGSFSRVLVRFSTGTAMRPPVPGPRFDWRKSGRPGSSSRWIWPMTFGSPVSGNRFRMLRPPRSKTRKMSAGRTVSHAGSGASCGSTPYSCRARSGSSNGGPTIAAPVPSRV